MITSDNAKGTCRISERAKGTKAVRKFIYQIFYNDQTRVALQREFIPLDNTKNLRPDWFEFWVILNFLRNNLLEDNAWYGFFSTKFTEKTGFAPEFVNDIIDNAGNTADVVLFSPGWDQLSFFLNPFEQGDFWHPGLSDMTQQFLDGEQLKINVGTLVADTASSVFSNYIVARKDFWIKWKNLAEAFFQFVERNIEFQSVTNYGSGQNPFPMKTFIQERLASLILVTGTFNIVTPFYSHFCPIFTQLFPDNVQTRILLQTCDLMKSQYRQGKDEKYLEMYWKIRGEIARVSSTTIAMQRSS